MLLLYELLMFSPCINHHMLTTLNTNFISGFHVQVYHLYKLRTAVTQKAYTMVLELQ